MKHLLKMLDLSQQEIFDILNLADKLKYQTKPEDTNVRSVTVNPWATKPLPP